LVVLEDVEVHPGAHHLRRRPRSAVGRGVDQVEDLERVDQRQGDDDVVGAPEIGHRDVPELLEPTGAVHRRRLVLVLRDALERREVEQHREARPQPDRRDHDGRQSRAVLAQPRLRQAAEPDVPQQRVDRAVLRVVQPAPDRGDRHERQHAGRVEHHAQNGLAADLAVQQDGQDEAQDHRDDDRDHRPDEVVDGGLLHHRVLEHRAVVV
jgi:hypothetical protein